MLRKKEPKVIITFHTTAEAIAMERTCKEASVPGRMIPVPRELSAGCGLAYCAPAEMKERLKELLVQTHLEWESMEEMLY